MSDGFFGWRGFAEALSILASVISALHVFRLSGNALHYSLLSRLLPASDSSSTANSILNSSTRPYSDIASLIIFTVATTCLFHLNARDQHQHLFYLSGLISGIFLGFALRLDLIDILLRVTPWTILLSLCTSRVTHCIMRPFERPVQLSCPSPEMVAKN
jgi:hypothetical protein